VQAVSGMRPMGWGAAGRHYLPEQQTGCTIHAHITGCEAYLYSGGRKAHASAYTRALLRHTAAIE